MSDNTSTASGGGIGFAGLLTILFIGLKLTHYIEWSWWWVLLPLWISALIAVALIVIFGVIALFQHLAEKKRLAARRASRGY